MSVEIASREDVLAPALFRGINARISELLDKHASIEGRASELRDFICECRDRDCTSTVSATAAEFDAICSSENLFLVDPSHRPEAPDRLVRTTPRFQVVELEASAGAKLDGSSRPSIGASVSARQPT